LAVGGGSAIDTAKAASAQARLPLVSVPTTYAGAEWTPYFGVRDRQRRMTGGGGGALLAGIVYEPTLTLALPREPTVGTAMNALAHCAEALYVRRREEQADQWALLGARGLARWLPEVVERPDDEEARRRLLEAAMLAGQALAASFMGLGHAMAQALGGRYGLPHGALNALCLPPALRFNQPVAAGALERFGRAMGATDPAARVQELALLGGFERLRDLGVPREELDQVARDTAGRPAAQANPRPASPSDIEKLLRSVW
jgi:maleylacetate reductase